MKENKTRVFAAIIADLAFVVQAVGPELLAGALLA